MNIFRFFKFIKFIKLCSKTHQITPFKKNSRGNMPPNPLANAMLRPAPQKVRRPLANPAYAHAMDYY